MTISPTLCLAFLTLLPSDITEANYILPNVLGLSNTTAAIVLQIKHILNFNWSKLSRAGQRASVLHERHCAGGAEAAPLGASNPSRVRRGRHREPGACFFSGISAIMASVVSMRECRNHP